ncbi:MAG: hypothetical protein WC707_00795 [Candidatus Babeliaceae bacterium]|jgi:Tol biopolymer transport system component
MIFLVTVLYVISILTSALQAHPGHEAPMNIFVGIIEPQETLVEVAQGVAEHLAYSKQFVVTCLPVEFPKSKQDVTKLFDSGYPLALFISQEKGSQAILWRLYDATRGVMCKGKRYDYNGLLPHHIAQTIAHDVWFEMTGEFSSFSSCISYIKKNKTKTTSTYNLCLMDYNGKHNKVLYATQRIIIVPAWNNDIKKLHIVFSEFTPYNVRLLAIDMQGKLRSVLDADGTYAGVAYAHKGKDVVYCRSGEVWHYHYDQDQKKGIHELIIQDDETCASPNITVEGDVIYCSQGKVKYYKKSNKSITIVTPEGYCVAPTYTSCGNKIAYSRRMREHMQLFVHDTGAGTHRQITFDKGDKTDSSWSPCGNYLAFVYIEKGLSQIGIIHVKTGARYMVTSPLENCSYPSWSPFLQ